MTQFLSFRLMIAFLAFTAAVVRVPFAAADQGMVAVNEEAETALRVTADPRIELLAAVQFLSGYEWSRLITRHDFPYKRAMAERFEPFRGHKAVTIFAEMSRTGFSFDAPVATVLHLGPPPELVMLSPIEDELVDRAGGRDKLDSFIEALRDFATITDFNRFYEEQQPFYDAIAQQETAKTANIDVELLETYYGIKQRSYTIILAPLFHPGGFGPRIHHADDRYDIYSVVGPQGTEGDRPTFGSADDFRYLVWHEFSHSFTNPLVDAHAERVDACSMLFDPIRAAMERQAYKSWRTCVYEHLVRAATCRFAALAQGEQAGRAAMRQEVDRSFIHVPALCAKLEEYESQREKYPTLADFFPQLIAVFEEAAKDPALIAALTPPHVEWSVPEPGAKDVDPGTTEIIVQFNEAMKPGGYSWTQQDQESFPEVTGKPYWKTPRICVLPVKLQPGRHYWIGLNVGQFTSFRNGKGIAAKEFIIEFDTKR